ncbi:MAG: hypothetical protein LBU32_00180 [Clostridiales bacterium]|jgi:hypothetical protein|nr:hypothetical protein [Clostridiales bacterium]
MPRRLALSIAYARKALEAGGFSRHAPIGAGIPRAGTVRPAAVCFYSQSAFNMRKAPFLMFRVHLRPCPGYCSSRRHASAPEKLVRSFSRRKQNTLCWMGAITLSLSVQLAFKKPGGHPPSNAVCLIDKIQGLTHRLHIKALDCGAIIGIGYTALQSNVTILMPDYP